MKTFLFYTIALFVISSFINVGAIHELPLQIDTPLKAVVMYFPSPALMRCLNHSDIPMRFRKTQIERQINLSDKKDMFKFSQNIMVGTTGKKFVFSGSLRNENEFIPITIMGGPYFGISKGGEIQGSFLFGLESILGLPKKVHVKDKIQDQALNFETFLKTTKGKIGNLNYNLELNGQDRNVNGKIRYFLNGQGMIGKEIIIVKGVGYKDKYELYEKYGPIEVFSTVKVYD